MSNPRLNRNNWDPEECWYRIGLRVAWYDNKSRSWITHLISNLADQHQIGDADFHSNAHNFLANYPEFK